MTFHLHEATLLFAFWLLLSSFSDLTCKWGQVVLVLLHGHPAWFYFEAVIKNVIRWAYSCSFHTLLSFPLGTHIIVGGLDHMFILFLIFWATPAPCSLMETLICIPTSCVWALHFLHNLANARPPSFQSHLAWQESDVPALRCCWPPLLIRDVEHLLHTFWLSDFFWGIST